MYKIINENTFFLTFQMSMKTLLVKTKMANCEKQALPTVRKMATWSSLLFHVCSIREA